MAIFLGSLNGAETPTQYFARLLAAVRAQVPTADILEALVRMGYTAEEIRGNLQRAARGERVRQPKQRVGAISCRTGSTGFRLCVYPGAEFSEDANEGQYATVCEEHGTLVFSPTLAVAKRLDATDFCGECRRIAL